jgi:Zn-dependent peptidase ImmA (M78 family)
LERAVEVREEAGFDDRTPVCVYEICRRLGVEVRFVGVSMEGMYRKGNPPQILLSALRPLARRVFTCGHELGHHAFGHGSTIDELKEEAARGTFNPDEFLVDTFSGHLLMPKIAVRKAYVLRGWAPETAPPEQVYTVACSLGVGYATLATHMGYSLKMITPTRVAELEKVALPKIRRTILGRPSDTPLVVADRHYLMPTVDAEVGTHLLLPTGAEPESEALEVAADLPAGRLFVAKQPGIVRAQVPATGWAVLVRVSRREYVGLCEYRHLEEEGDDEE